MAQLANNLFGRAVIVFLMLAIIKLEQPANALTPTVVVVAGISILANFLQFSKALSPIDYTAVKVTDFKAVQPLNELSPNVAIDAGRVIVSKAVQPSKALFDNKVIVLVP